MIYVPQSLQRSAKPPPPPPPPPPTLAACDAAAAELEAEIASALFDICPAYAQLAAGCVRRAGERCGPDLETAVAATVYWAALKNGAASSDAQDEVLLQSRFGLLRSVSKAALATLIADALPPLGAAGLRLASLRVVDGASGRIVATTAARRAQMAAAGRVACERCGRHVLSHTGGLEWHLKAAHGVTAHTEAAAAE